MEKTVNSTSVICFSPKGGTLKCATALAQGMGGKTEIINITNPLAREKECQPQESDVVVFAFPVFGGHPQKFFRDYIKKVNGNNKAILVAVYGNRDYDMAFREVYDTVTANGFEVIACVAAVAEHSFNNDIQAGRPDADDVRLLSAFGSRIAEKLNGDCRPLVADEIPQKPVNLAMIGMHGVRLRSMTPARPIVGADCIKCGQCSAACPAGIIDKDNPEIIADGCIFCRACARVCPVKAIDFPQENFAIVAQDCMKEFGNDVHTPEIWL